MLACFNFRKVLMSCHRKPLEELENTKSLNTKSLNGCEQNLLCLVNDMENLISSDVLQCVVLAVLQNSLSPLKLNWKLSFFTVEIQGQWRCHCCISRMYSINSKDSKFSSFLHYRVCNRRRFEFALPFQV